MQKRSDLRNFGLTWKSRLNEARVRAAAIGPRLSYEQITNLQSAVSSVDVSSPENMALLWSGRDILTGVPIDEATPDGPKWWDKLSCREAEVLRTLGVAWSLEDTPGGEFLLSLQLNYPETDPLFVIVRNLWDILSSRFAGSATGRIEIIAEGAFNDSVFRTVELETLLSNDKITAINGLDRKYFPSNAGDAFSLLRRWDVERSRRYSEFIASTADATPHECTTALDDFREIQLWYEQDFFDYLGPNRKLPALSDDVINAVDQSKVAGAWKYSTEWRKFIRQTEDE
ncbi:MAG: hypothetical protein U1D41_16120 [Nitrosomonas sp.]|uniref:hypothetical protein n=1 Tax=Nitrosomonas sp. TaxID=42353 RepID=UPI002734DF8D|nr:hypothetical protein [Nitrosomonas sp.]MDP3281932.1 hypothetical protein [Nitrosomonas sp.]MDP3664880.1 hypothetical protein [Nitrosomonas sp.]MDZ4107641.1 hypothetical protein [Nitrosomonas sp.]